VSGPHAEKAQAIRHVRQLVLARGDARIALALVAEVEERVELDVDAGSDLTWGLLTGIVVSYLRAFTHHKPLPDTVTTFDDRPDLARLHERLVFIRDKVLAHSDASSDDRSIVLMGTGEINGASPIALESRVLLAPAASHQLRELLEFQLNRYECELARVVPIACRDKPLGSFQMASLDEL
jgi:hypothetical protein